MGHAVVVFRLPVDPGPRSGTARGIGFQPVSLPTHDRLEAYPTGNASSAARRTVLGKMPVAWTRRPCHFFKGLLTPADQGDDLQHIPLGERSLRMLGARHQFVIPLHRQ